MRVTLEWTLYQAGWQTSDILCRGAQDPEGGKSTGQTVLRCSLPGKCSVAPMSGFRADAQAPETRPPVEAVRMPVLVLAHDLRHAHCGQGVRGVRALR
jgi:hypothetical protein